MQNTCRAFWKMIMDRECHAIIMLGHLNENGRVSSLTLPYVETTMTS